GSCSPLPEERNFYDVQAMDSAVSGELLRVRDRLRSRGRVRTDRYGQSVQPHWIRGTGSRRPIERHLLVPAEGYSKCLVSVHVWRRHPKGIECELSNAQERMPGNTAGRAAAYNRMQ